MKIRIFSEKHRVTVPLPNMLILNPLSAVIFLSISKIDVPYANVQRLFKELRKSRRCLNGKPLVYVRTANDGVVEIKL